MRPQALGEPLDGEERVSGGLLRGDVDQPVLDGGQVVGGEVVDGEGRGHRGAPPGLSNVFGEVFSVIRS
ncbi:hypothetical protein ABT093_06530 [Kitasatospora sp. NPDC002551]|uniref:hypothetical protein n=1 Tax=unclassified Kitasatospora TaxID=2633591 RepID=UPI0033189AD5